MIDIFSTTQDVAVTYMVMSHVGMYLNISVAVILVIEYFVDRHVVFKFKMILTQPLNYRCIYGYLFNPTKLLGLTSKSAYAFLFDNNDTSSILLPSTVIGYSDSFSNSIFLS